MSRYAEGTSVPVDQSRREVEKVLQRYGASGFGYAWDRREEKRCRAYHPENKPKPDVAECAAGHHAGYIETDIRELVHITFKLNERVVRLDVPMPTKHEAGGSNEKLERRTRERWRALVLVLKAKLEAVTCGISTLETEFLANMVMRNGMTIGQAMLHRLPDVVETGRLLPAPGETT
jgi:hypothetical protein